MITKVDSNSNMLILIDKEWENNTWFILRARFTNLTYYKEHHNKNFVCIINYFILHFVCFSYIDILIVSKNAPLALILDIWEAIRYTQNCSNYFIYECLTSHLRQLNYISPLFLEFYQQKNVRLILDSKIPSEPSGTWFIYCYFCPNPSNKEITLLSDYENSFSNVIAKFPSNIAKKVRLHTVDKQCNSTITRAMKNGKNMS